MSREDTADQYNKIARNYSAVRNPVQQFALGPTLLTMCGDITGKTVLDLGCGNGYYTRFLAQHKPSRIVGLDISSEMIRLAQENTESANQDIEYLVADAKTFTIPEKFDVITAVYVLNYSATKAELRQICHNILRHLTTNGRFCTITVTPHLKPRQEFVRQWKFTHPNHKESFENGDPILAEVKNEKTGEISSFISYYWDEETYTECLNNAGFSQVNWQYNLTISSEGLKAYSEDFWQEVRTSSIAAGIQCLK